LPDLELNGFWPPDLGVGKVGDAGSWYRGERLGYHDEDNAAGAALLLEGLIEVPLSVRSSPWAKGLGFPCGRQRRCDTGTLLKRAVLGSVEVGL
jgi:hypothetical protein